MCSQEQLQWRWLAHLTNFPHLNFPSGNHEVAPENGWRNGFPQRKGRAMVAMKLCCSDLIQENFQGNRVAGNFHQLLLSWIHCIVYAKSQWSSFSRFDPWVEKTLWRRERQHTPVFLPGQSHGQRSWWVTVHRVAKSQIWLSVHTHMHTWNLGQFSNY